MLIVNADDLGRSPLATDRIFACYANGSLSATSAMVFMDDSERAALVTRGSSLDIGLHLNFTEQFNHASQAIASLQSRVIRFLRKTKYSFLFYHPWLRHAFRDLVKVQLEEFQRIFGVAPTHIDGHHHMHLCSNVLAQNLIPSGSVVRRSFSFKSGEKSFWNRAYRLLLDRRVKRLYRSTDYLFSLSSSLNAGQIKHVVEQAKVAAVELQCHPELNPEYEYLMSREWAELKSTEPLSTFASLNRGFTR
ncbi:MAG: ChbG/HpnK family deacetylase [Nitrospirota bacterium]|nr:ChbG/HpnK family deacetylase [Nitrospirota bacterium]